MCSADGPLRGFHLQPVLGPGLRLAGGRAPDLFERVKQRVAEGRWEPVGGSWVEPDGQVTGGESISASSSTASATSSRRSAGAARRLAAGRLRFLAGAPAAAARRRTDRLLHVQAQLERDQRLPLRPLRVGGDRRQHASPPTSSRTPATATTATSRRWTSTAPGATSRASATTRRACSPSVGATAAAVRASRCSRTTPGSRLPRPAPPAHGPRRRVLRRAPGARAAKWVGELYLEFHRGTLTTQAMVKKLNREAEHRLLEAEALATLAALHGGATRRRARAAWKTLLFNQFHDILPGSSIHEVYEDTHQELADVVRTARSCATEPCARRRHAEPALPRGQRRPEPASPLGRARAETAEQRVAGADGRPLPAQEVEGGLLVHAPDAGAGTRLEYAAATHESAPARARVAGVGARSRAGAPCWRTSTSGSRSARTARSRRLRQGGRPRGAGRTGQPALGLRRQTAHLGRLGHRRGLRAGRRGVTGVASVEVVGERAAPRRRAGEPRWRGSTIVQTYRLLSGSRRLDVETHIDWHERKVLLRALFPLAVRSHEATYETMYGAVRRPTHRNTSWDATRFEVSAHRFSDLSEPGYGVALLNDGKYGHSAKGNVARHQPAPQPPLPRPVRRRGRAPLHLQPLPPPRRLDRGGGRAGGLRAQHAPCPGMAQETPCRRVLSRRDRGRGARAREPQAG